MHVIESGQIGAFVSKFGVPEVEPHSSSDFVIDAVKLTRRVRMKMLFELSESLLLRATK